MSISFTIETLAFLEALKVQFPCNHLYHRIFLFVSSSPTCHVFYERSKRRIPARTVTQKSIPLGSVQNIPHAHETLFLNDK